MGIRTSIPPGAEPMKISLQIEIPTLNEFFENDKSARRNVEGVVNNVVEMIKLDAENKIKNKIIPVSEQKRRI
ncbi:MAG: hypothetical protein ACLP9S_13120 [Syntrophales bacterium]